MYVKNLRFTYKDSRKDILKDISFTLKEGKVNVLVGLNGAGKTTLFDCLSHIIEPQGEIKSVPSIDEILYLTQTIYFSPELKGKEFVKFIRRIDNQKAGKSPDLYTEGMDDRNQELFRNLWDTKFGKMSVGEKRWLMVTMVSQIKRKLYLLDEPTSGVDPSSRMQILKKISELVKGGSCCLMSTHQLQDLSHIDCNLIMLHEGRIIYEGDYHSWLTLNQTENPDIAFDRSITG